MIRIETTCIGRDGRGLLWSAAATYAGREFVVERTHQPTRHALRAVIDGTPEFIDSPWQLVRDGRVDLRGNSARWMAARTVSEGEKGTRLRLDEVAAAAIYDPPPIPGTGDTVGGEEPPETGRLRPTSASPPREPSRPRPSLGGVPRAFRAGRAGAVDGSSPTPAPERPLTTSTS
jgi:hypothetical protein